MSEDTGPFLVDVPVANVITKGGSSQQLSDDTRRWFMQNIGSNYTDRIYAIWDYLGILENDGERVARFRFLDKKHAALFKLFFA